MKRLILSFTFCLLLVPHIASASFFTFDYGSDLSAWRSDRTMPAAFETTEEGNLAIGIAPPLPEQEFYQTFGMKTDIDMPAMGNMIVGDLFVDNDWNDMRAGLWGVVGDGESIIGYPIISWHAFEESYGFNVWDGDHWESVGEEFQKGNTWYSLGIAFTNSTIDFYIDDTQVYQSTSYIPLTIDNIILNSKNTAEENEYTVLWDNVGVQPVPTPEPSTFLLLGAGLAGLLVAGRKKLGAQ